MTNKNKPVQAVVNVVKIMDYISDRGEVGISELSKVLGIPKTTVFRLIKSLESVGIVIETHEELYALSYKILNYQAGVNKDQNLIYYSKSSLEKLSELTGESVNLAIKSLNKTFIIHTEVGEYYSLQSRMIPESDLYCSSTGKIFLSYMTDDEIKEYYSHTYPERTVNTITSYSDFKKEQKKILATNIAYDNEEYEYGLTCLSTPIKLNGTIIASISISGPTTRLKFKNFSFLEESLLKISKEIEDNLSHIKAT